LNSASARALTRNVLVAGVVAVVACVSLSRPTQPSGNVPVVRGAYKSGSEQQVRILLAIPDSGAELGSTGDWAVFPEGSDRPIKQFTSSQSVRFPSRTYPGRAYQTCTANAFCTDVQPRSAVPTDRGTLVARPLGNDSYITWAGKRYRGELVLSAGDSGVVNRLSMDSYLRGVVPLEIGNRTAAEVAAVQAQAVAARTYAYKHLNSARAFDMYATVQDQVYGGVDAEKPQSDSAITATADVVVLYNGQPITTPYHSTCGGSTAGVSEVWYDQADEPYLKPVSDKIPGTDHYYCDPSPRFAWTQGYDAAGLRAVMEKYLATYTNAPKSGLGKITDIREAGRTRSGRVAALVVQTENGSYTLRGNDIRFVLRDPKGAILNSTLFSVSEDKSGGEVSTLTVSGRGYGHGIGMCQWGAIGRARAGQNYRTILETYYPGTTIGRITS
jgi:stage II sporulation protein D